MGAGIRKENGTVLETKYAMVLVEEGFGEPTRFVPDVNSPRIPKSNGLAPFMRLDNTWGLI